MPQTRNSDRCARPQGTQASILTDSFPPGSHRPTAEIGQRRFP